MLLMLKVNALLMVVGCADFGERNTKSGCRVAADAIAAAGGG